MIIDRRTLLTSGAVVSTAALVPGFGAGALSESNFRIERFVYDDRFSVAIEAARTAAAKDIQLSAVSGDMTALWYNDLNLRWKRQPMTLAGVTGEEALFVLSTLAPEYRMRVVHQEDMGIAKVRSPVQIESMPLYSWVIAPAK